MVEEAVVSKCTVNTKVLCGGHTSVFVTPLLTGDAVRSKVARHLPVCGEYQKLFRWGRRRRRVGESGVGGGGGGGDVGKEVSHPSIWRHGHSHHLQAPLVRPPTFQPPSLGDFCRHPDAWVLCCMISLYIHVSCVREGLKLSICVC